MRVLAMVHAYPPLHNAGGEMTMHALLASLTPDHEVDVLLSSAGGVGRDYVYDGVTVHPYTGVGDPFRWFGNPERHPDVVVTHLENTLRAAALCGSRKIPLVHVVHNDHDWTMGCFRRGPTNLAVFNTEWMAKAYADYWATVSSAPQPPHTVIHPVVDPELYVAPRTGRSITLINLNEEKGAATFWALARLMPEIDFLGVRGAYGEQLTQELPNVTVLDHQAPTEMATRVYGQTKILLMPSSYESYGRTAIEAAYNGIPTIAHPTPGLLEALGDAGTFVDRDDIDGWVKAITYLRSPRGFSAASKKALAHAHSLDPAGQLKHFKSAIEGVVRRGFATRIG